MEALRASDTEINEFVMQLQIREMTCNGDANSEYYVGCLAGGRQP